MTVLISVNASKQVGDVDHLKVFANADAAETWFEENDPEGVAFEYALALGPSNKSRRRGRPDHYYYLCQSDPEGRLTSGQPVKRSFASCAPTV